MHPGAHPTPIRVLAVGPSAKGGIKRLLDAVRTELAEHPLADIRLLSLTTRADVPGRLGGAVAAPCIFATALVRAIALLASGRVDVVHVNLASYGSTYRKLVIAACAAMFGVPYVIHLHGGNFRNFWSSCGAWLARRIDAMFEGAARIIVMSRSALDLVAERLPACCAAIVVLPNAAPRGRSRTLERNDRVRILFLGKLGPLKGVPELVSALDLLRSEPAWSATIAGDGAVAETRSMVERLGLSARIAVPGWLGNANVARALESADVLVLPSHVETTPLAVIEAFAHGLAVVATPVGAVPELVDDGHTGVLVPPGDARALADALRRLIADPALRRRLGANASAFHERHLEIGTYVRRLADVWRAAAVRVDRRR
jgi:glycosyltransferase involved in cell wall biosynthesis